MDKEKIEKAVIMMLEAIGEDPNRAGLIETPSRVAKMYEEIFEGIEQDPKSVMKILPSQQHDEIVLAKNIPFYSMCEHHLLPFHGKANVAYLPSDKGITGISKLSRVVSIISKRPQLQERLTTQIAETIMEALSPKGVMVVIEAEHLCMTMRGIKKSGASILTSVVRGIFRDNPATRAEVVALMNK